jgi:hypothetical protein
MSQTTPIPPFVAGSALSARRLNQLVEALDSVRQVRGSGDAGVTQTADGVSVRVPESTPPRGYPSVVVRISGPDSSGAGFYSGRITTLNAIAGATSLAMPQGMVLPAVDDALVMNLPEDSTGGAGFWTGLWANGVIVGAAPDGRRIVAADRTGALWGTVISINACANSVVLRPFGAPTDGSADVTCHIVFPAALPVARVGFVVGDVLPYLLTGVRLGICLSAEAGGIEVASDGTSVVAGLGELNIINNHGGREDFSVTAGAGGCVAESTAALEWNGIEINGAFTDGACNGVRNIVFDPDDDLSSAVAADLQAVPVLLRVNCPAEFVAGVRGQLPVSGVTVSGGVQSVTCDPTSGTITIVETLMTIQVPAGAPVDVGAGS